MVATADLVEGDTHATYLPLDAAKHPVSKILYYSRAPRHPTHQVFSVLYVFACSSRYYCYGYGLARAYFYGYGYGGEVG